MILDFTLDKYRELCEALSDYKVLTVIEYLSHKPLERVIILRHDVDRMPKNAFRLAELENDLGIKSTYYFRYTNETFKKEIIKAVFDMGHEVGYHYETLSKANGNHEEAIRIFIEELAEFRKICDVKTVSMHGRPLSKYINDEIWKQRTFNEFNLLGDGSLSISDVNYFTDAGRSWDNRNNIRDQIKFVNPQDYKIRATDDLINLLSDQGISSLYLNVHPERWANSIPELYFSYSRDLCYNISKSLIKSVRNYK